MSIIYRIVHAFLLCAGIAGAQYCSLSASAAQAQQFKLGHTTGNALLDTQLNNELQVLINTFGVRPGFLMLDDSMSGPNAFAIPAVYLPGTEATVVFGYNLMMDEFRETQAPVNYTITAIMAHEFGHVVQMKFGSRLSPPDKERQADFLAGWYMGNRNHLSPDAVQNMYSVMRSFFEKGDTAFFDVSHHGTPVERANNVLAGAQSFQMPLMAVFRKSDALFSNASANTHVEHGDPENRLQNQRGSQSDDGPDSVSDDDSALTQILRTADRKALGQFRGALTDSDSDMKTWDSSVKLPAAHSCNITLFSEDHGVCSFFCRYKFDSEEEAEAKQQALLDSVQRLYPNARLRKPTRSVSASGRTQVRQSVRAENWAFAATVSTDKRGTELRVSVIPESDEQ